MNWPVHEFVEVGEVCERRTHPSDLGTKKPGLHQSVTSETLARTPLLIRSWMVISAGSLYILGTRLAKTFKGFELS